MAYTPINWQTGDTITAEKLNRCDNGWSVAREQYFSETVTTVYNGDFNLSMGVLEYTGALNADVIVFEFEGTTYSVPGVQMDEITYMYGTFTEFGPDFSEFPFLIQSSLYDTSYPDEGYENMVVTENPGSYAMSATNASDTVEVSQNFAAAVNAAAPPPMRCVSGVTTMDEMDAARTAGRMMYTYYGGVCYFVHSFVLTPDSTRAVRVIPDDTYINAGFDYDGVFAITEF